jgi:hypothetical protein
MIDGSNPAGTGRMPPDKKVYNIGHFSSSLIWTTIIQNQSILGDHQYDHFVFKKII